LLNIYLAVQPERNKGDILEEVKDMTWGDFKPVLCGRMLSLRISQSKEAMPRNQRMT
jgi:hypothetical protein